jgi:hypothetical protein
VRETSLELRRLQSAALRCNMVTYTDSCSSKDIGASCDRIACIQCVNFPKYSVQRIRGAHHPAFALGQLGCVMMQLPLAG